MVKCQFVNCAKRALYGKVYRKPDVCTVHRTKGDFAAYEKRCEAIGCSKIASFGLVHGKRQTCAAHKLDEYFHLTNKLCKAVGCKKQPTFGLVERKPLFCAAHKVDGYFDVRSKLCENNGCGMRPTFGLVRGHPRSCAVHRCARYFSVTNKRCETDGCEKHPNFGLVRGQPLSCAAHKVDGYFDVKSKLCDTNGCKTQPNFGLEMGKPTSCRAHASDNYVDVVAKRCASAACIVYPPLQRPRGKYKVKDVSYCGSCLRSMHPNLAKTFKVRTEHLVLAEIERQMPELENNFLSWDCPLPCAISTERADMLWQVGSTLLHIEVDETSTHEDDRNRLMRLHAATDSINHIVIRIHTHSYEHYKPCVIRSQINGEWVVRARQQEFDRRMELVVAEIKKLLAENKPVVKVMFLD